MSANKFGVLIPVSLFLVMSNANADLCTEKSAELSHQGMSIISCKSVDFGVKAISSDYQKKRTEPAAVYPSAIREDLGNGQKGRYLNVNENPGILNSRYFNPITSPIAPVGDAPKQGFSLLSKFSASLGQRYPEDSGLLKWMGDANGFMKEVIPDPSASDMSGRCEAWSAWSLDPEIRKSLGRMSHGILCNEMIPYTRGELKELITLLYPVPAFSSIKFVSGVYSGWGESSPQEVEDANLALAKIGALGAGSDLNPDQVVEMALEAKSRGENMILDIDPGHEIWNQPVESVIDVSFVDSKHPSLAGLTSDDYESDVNVLDSDQFLADLKNAEEMIRSEALQGKTYRSFFMGIVCKQSGESDCPEGDAPLSQQVDLLAKYRESALKKGLLKAKPAEQVRHQIFIQYGVEGGFADSKDQPSKTRVLEYASIGKRKVWSPSGRSLSEVCGSGKYEREDHNSVLRDLDLASECADFKSGKIKDRIVLTGSLPPKKFETYTATPQFGSDPDSQMKKKAYEHLLDMIKGCEVYDQGVAFLNHLQTAMASNDLSKNEIRNLASEYRGVSRFLDEGFIRDQVSGELKSSGGAKLEGLNALYAALFKP
jgi:hypothetical protein